MKDYVCRLYTVLYSEKFEANQVDPTYSACGEGRGMQDRERLINSALRYGQNNPTKTKNAKIEAPAELTTFKPFSVSEMDFDIWDNSKSKQDQFLQRLDERKMQKIY